MPLRRRALLDQARAQLARNLRPVQPGHLRNRHILRPGPINTSAKIRVQNELFFFNYTELVWSHLALQTVARISYLQAHAWEMA